MARSGYIAILKKSEKGLELVSSLQHSAKNMLERLPYSTPVFDQISFLWH